MREMVERERYVWYQSQYKEKERRWVCSDKGDRSVISINRPECEHTAMPRMATFIAHWLSAEKLQPVALEDLRLPFSIESFPS